MKRKPYRYDWMIDIRCRSETRLKIPIVFLDDVTICPHTNRPSFMALIHTLPSPQHKMPVARSNNLIFSFVVQKIFDQVYICVNILNLLAVIPVFYELMPSQRHLSAGAMVVDEEIISWAQVMLCPHMLGRREK